jgi:peptidoglycan/xylan/chitin deacetylase (PgdA/CDA1 family)
MSNPNKKSVATAISIVLISVFTAATFVINTYLLFSARGENLQGELVNPFAHNSLDEVLSGVAGRIPILMYHIVLTPSVEDRFPDMLEKNRRYVVTSDEFRNHLELLHLHNFRNISLDEYLSLMRGEEKRLARLPPKTRLYVLTFDDATYGQFDFIGRDDNGSPIIDPYCAVGVMLDFAKKNPDFKLNAAFAVDFSSTPFIERQHVAEKLNLLLDYGFEIVNHTANHKNLESLMALDPRMVDYEIGRAMELFESYLGYRAASINKVCYPGGKQSPELREYVGEINYKGKVYNFIAGLNATGYQARNPNDNRFDPFFISRIEINEEDFARLVLNAQNLYVTPAQEKSPLSTGLDLTYKSNKITEILE